jgi:CHAT domain-containing protein
LKQLFITFIILISLSIKGQSLKIAQNYLDRSDYKRAVPLYEKIATEAKKANIIDLEVKAQNGLADCYTDLGAYYKSNVLLKENLKLLNAEKSKNYKLLAETHLLMAHNFDNLFFFEDYLNHCNKYYYFINKEFPKKRIYKALYYAYLGKYYNVKYQIDKANSFTETALKIYHKNKKDANLIDVYKLYNAHCFTNRNTKMPFTDRYKYIDTLLFHLNKKFPFNNIKKSKFLVSAQMLEFDKGYNLSLSDDESGKHYINKTIEVFNKALINYDNCVGTNYDISAKINGLKNLLYLASKNYKKSLNECNLGIERISEREMLNLGFSSNNYHIINLLRQKHLVLDELNKLNSKKAMQQQIIDNLLLMEKIWLRYSQDQININSDFMSNMYNQNPYSFLFQAYLKMFAITNDKKYLEKIHEYDEKSKYNSLLSTAYLSPKQKKEKQLLYNKRQQIYLIYDDYILSKNNYLSNKNNIKEKLLELINTYNQVEEKTELFKQSNIVSIKQIQEGLSSKDAVVSYSNGELVNNNLYAKIITKNKIEIIKANEFNDIWLNSYHLKLEFIKTSIENQDIKNFKLISRNIYKDIFDKIDKLLPKEINHIEIIPNSELSNFPFEILLNFNSKINDFRRLPYLIHKYNFSYSLSSSITKLEKTKRGKLLEKTAVFSPIFDKQNLSQLQFSRDISKSISSEYNAILYDGKEASIETFKKALQSCKIVSIFSHGQALSDFDNNNKGVYFSDGFLNLNEIYKLHSNCDFLLLGACETGLGGKDDGEGNISLARAFSSIGVKSMLLASWKIDEESTMKITESFLKYLQEGYSKSEALQKAKLDFLNNSNPRNANPFYWAGLNVIGNNENIKPQQTQSYLWWLLLIFPLSGMIWYYKRRRLN